MKRKFLIGLALIMVSPLLLPTTVATFGQQVGQQVADPNFDAKVTRPAYRRKHPKVLFDEAHSNFHTTGGRYRPFADLIANDGYRVVPNKQEFSRDTLKGHRILVIVNALAPESKHSPEWSERWFQDAAQPAFSERECEAVRDWVRAGGSLLLIADHRPFGPAAEILAKQFGVEMSKGYTFDRSNQYQEMNNPGCIVYTREKRMLSDHPITRGRDETERINRVITFVGQSLKGPAASAALLSLADTAVDRENLLTSTPEISAAGRAQAIAMKFGRGRVVVVGEAAMLSAQLGGTRKFGMNIPGIDNRQLGLNIMHWLGGLLE